MDQDYITSRMVENVDSDVYLAFHSLYYTIKAAVLLVEDLFANTFCLPN